MICNCMNAFARCMNAKRVGMPGCEFAIVSDMLP